jgi:hypothetical protein
VAAVDRQPQVTDASTAIGYAYVGISVDEHSCHNDPAIDLENPPRNLGT